MEPTKEKENTAEEDVTQAFGRWELYDLKCCRDRLVNDEKELSELKGQHVIMLMGNTGAGKSTIVNALVRGAEGIEVLDDGTYDVKEDQQLMKNGRRMFIIGH